MKIQQKLSVLKGTVFFINFQYHNSENFLTNDIAVYNIFNL